MVGWAVIGSICGVISAFIFPHRLLPPSRLPGLSLIVAPLVSGALMKVVGDRRREAGKDTTILATVLGRHHLRVRDGRRAVFLDPRIVRRGRGSPTRRRANTWR